MNQTAPKPLDPPVVLSLEGRDVTVESVQQAILLLSDVNWPGPRDALHADALETCVKVLDGHRSTEDARKRLTEVARAAGVYVK
jgi:hypothetical protein